MNRPGQHGRLSATRETSTPFLTFAEHPRQPPPKWLLPPPRSGDAPPHRFSRASKELQVGPPRPRSRRLGFPEVPRLRPASSSQAPPGGARERDSSSRRPVRHVPGGRTARNGGG